MHEVGSNNPDGIEIKENLGPDGHPVDGIPSHPYYTFHDIFGVTVFLVLFTAVVFFAPEMGGYFLEANNFIPADSLKTPLHIAPTWYFTPFYSILRATTSEFLYVVQAGIAAYVTLIYLKTKLPAFVKIGIAAIALLVIIGMMPFGFDAKFWGVVLFGSSVMILAGMPWLDKSPVKSIRYRPDWHKIVFIIFGIAFIVLGYLGVEPPSPIRERISQVCALIYFGFFLLMPWWSAMGTFKPVPKRVTFKPH